MPFNACFPCCIKFYNEEVDKKLDFSNMSLESNFPNILQFERTLEQLYLTSTQIKSLPPELFYCQNLKILFLNNNSLCTIPNAIGSLWQLQCLNLNRNFISSLPDNLKSCKNLTHLDLSCNNLQKIPDALTYLINLQELLLNETYLEYLPANFGRLLNLKVLELRLNNLMSLPKSMARLYNLQRIDIGNNDFTELPEVIGELTKLRELWIDFNQIRSISSNISKLCDLQHFEADGNVFTDMLPEEICNWSNIEVLSFSRSSLSALPIRIGMLKSLITLKCDTNELVELPDSISYLENLEELNVSNNYLNQLPSSIGMLRKLRFFFADNNKLTKLPNELCSCISLRVLSVSRNKITELPENIGHLLDLNVLNVINNHILVLPVSILNLSNLKSLWISNNQVQPLVPLQYIDNSTKAQLTCFMLPQRGNKPINMDGKINNNSEIKQSSDGNHIQNEVVSNEGFTARHIYFAEEPFSDKCNQNNFSRDSVNQMLEMDAIRLTRSPTPYPKELRLMARGKFLEKRLSYQLQIMEYQETKQFTFESNDKSESVYGGNNIKIVQDRTQPGEEVLRKPLERGSKWKLETQPSFQTNINYGINLQELNQIHNVGKDSLLLIQPSGALTNLTIDNIDYRDLDENKEISTKLNTRIVSRDVQSADAYSNINQGPKYEILPLASQLVNDQFDKLNKEKTNTTTPLNSAKPWLFGKHKNPTVKQILIKRENVNDFEIISFPNKEGIFISSVVPNSNAQRLLRVNDKLLQIDGHDLINSDTKFASQLLMTGGSVLQIMLSRT